MLGNFTTTNLTNSFGLLDSSIARLLAISKDVPERSNFMEHKTHFNPNPIARILDEFTLDPSSGNSVATAVALASVLCEYKATIANAYRTENGNVIVDEYADAVVTAVILMSSQDPCADNLALYDMCRKVEEALALHGRVICHLADVKAREDNGVYDPDHDYIHESEIVRELGDDGAICGVKGKMAPTLSSPEELEQQVARAEHLYDSYSKMSRKRPRSRKTSPRKEKKSND